ncbi:hypothetical protein BLA29_014246, partial [Euroglyphus maynei]
METVQQCRFEMASKMKLNDLSMEIDNCNSSAALPIPGYIAPDKPTQCKWSLNKDSIVYETNPHYHRKHEPKPKVMDNILEHI